MDVQQTTINAVRILSAEAIQKAKSGHPGLPMGSAPIGYTLFQNFLKFQDLFIILAVLFYFCRFRLLFLLKHFFGLFRSSYRNIFNLNCFSVQNFGTGFRKI